jgi:hypothetical protein
MKKNNQTLWIIGIIVLFLFIEVPLSIYFEPEGGISTPYNKVGIEIQDIEQITNMTISGSYGTFTNQITACVPYNYGNGASISVAYQICRDAGYQDVVQNSWLCDSGGARCYKNQEVPIKDVVIKVAGQQVLSCDGDCVGTFKTQDFSNVINTYCSVQFDTLYNCKNGITQCSSTTDISRCLVNLEMYSSNNGRLDGLTLNKQTGDICFNTPTYSDWSSCIDSKQTRTITYKCDNSQETQTQSCSTSSTNQTISPINNVSGTNKTFILIGSLLIFVILIYYVSKKDGKKK